MSIHCQNRGILFLLHYGCICDLVLILCLYYAQLQALSVSVVGLFYLVLTLSIAICTVLLYFSSFCLCLSSVADFANTGTKTPTSAPLFYLFEERCGLAFGLSESHGDLSMAVFYLINRRHPYRWVAIVSWLNCDLSRWHVGFFRSPSGEARCWREFGFIRLTSHPPCCFPWLLRFNLWENELNGIL